VKAKASPPARASPPTPSILQVTTGSHNLTGIKGVLVKYATAQSLSANRTKLDHSYTFFKENVPSNETVSQAVARLKSQPGENFLVVYILW
jgi:hypothetical protein